ncbi:SIR2-domain-containing protein [Nadsonia fulvescens var. elongata DSM 6958]|uniref:NAD-dependent protein deacetylase n=1 Tax=Nadsonia fulvescens var. elongata DSM 6958 TaxID=857566 RepID=A0A1E3PL15_9ASCO|nr:SIR2-domain-containing protein [Nadsonia fulvescens var. elongata DSM 6958]
MFTLQSFSDDLKSAKFKSIVFLVGAGISTSSGIPDFRSPETGLYANLSKLNLPYPEAVFDIEYFRENPEPFYTLAGELWPGKFHPSKFHGFMRLIEKKGWLKRIYTQNIDTLERMTGIKDETIVEAHGSFARNFCIDCQEEVENEFVEKIILQNEARQRDSGTGKLEAIKIPKCPRSNCSGIIKPSIVFFGEGLPSRFFDLSTDDLSTSDLVIVAGTSLTVFPFASLAQRDMLSKECKRILINGTLVGDFPGGKGRKVHKSKYPTKELGQGKVKYVNDLVCLGDIDRWAADLVRLCEWEDELDKIIQETRLNVESVWGKCKNTEVQTVTTSETLISEVSEIVEKLKLNDNITYTETENKDEATQIEKSEKPKSS